MIQVLTDCSSGSEDATNDEPHVSVAHKFPYLQASTRQLARPAERIGAYIKVGSPPSLHVRARGLMLTRFSSDAYQTYNASSPSPPTTVQTYIGLLTFQS